MVLPCSFARVVAMLADLVCAVPVGLSYSEPELGCVEDGLPRWRAAPYQGATNVTIAALLAAYYLLKEQEEEEAQERKRSHWVNPHLLERRTKGRYETSNLHPELCNAMLHLLTASVSSTWEQPLIWCAMPFFSALCGQFPKWAKENMLKWSEEFEKQWNFPN
ncbi:hypothetical protein ACLKA6_007776 [Drosophila palustris]